MSRPSTRARTLRPATPACAAALLALLGYSHRAAAASPEELQDRLEASIAAWPDLERGLKKLDDLEVRQDGDAVVLRGSVKAWGVTDSTFEARFEGDAVTGLRIAFDPSDERKRRLNGGVGDEFARGSDLADFLPASLLEEKDRVHADAVEVAFEHNRVQRMTLEASVEARWRPIETLDVRLQDVHFSFTVATPEGRDRTLTAALDAELMLDGTPVAVGGEVRGKGEGVDWTLHAKADELSLGGLIDALPGDAMAALPVVDPVRALALRDVGLEIDLGEGAVSGQAGSPLGDVAFRARKGGATSGRGKKATSSKADFALGVALAPGGELAEAVPALAIVDKVGLEDLALVITSGTMQPDLATLPASIQDMTLAGGLSIAGTYNLGAVSKDISELLGTDHLSVSASVGRDLKSLDLQGTIVTSGKGIRLVPNSDAAMLREINTHLKVDPQGPSLELGAKVDIQADQQTLTFQSKIGLDLAGPAVLVEGQLVAVDGDAAATWDNPLGINPDLHLRDLALQVGVTLRAPVPLPLIGFQGELIAGDLANPDFQGFATVGIDTANPQNLVIDAGFDELTLVDITRGLTPDDVWSSTPDEVKQVVESIALQDVRLTVVPSPTGVDLFGNHYDPGLLIQGKTSIATWDGELFVKVDASKGIEARASADPIELEPFFALRGADGQDGPSINVLLEASTNSRVALSGQLTLLGISQEADVRVLADGFDARVGGALFDSAFEANLQIAGGDLKDGGRIYVKAEMENNLLSYLDENTAKAINAATEDLQGQVREARADVASAQADVDKYGAMVDTYREQLEDERDQTCQDIHDRSPAVANAEAEVARARQSLDNLDQDPGVVRARQDLQRAEADLRDAQDAVNNWDSDPGVVRARRDLENARRKVESLQRQIDEANAAARAAEEAVSDEWYRVDKAFEAGGQYAAVGTLTAAKATADGVLQAAEETMNGAIYAAQEAAKGALQAAEGTVWTSRQAMDGAIIAARETAQAAMRGAEGTLMAARKTNDAAALACRETPIEVDPRLSGLMASEQTARGALIAADGVLVGYREAGTGSMQAALWLEQNANPLSVFDLKQAKFEGCLSALDGGTVNLGMRGTFAGEPVELSMPFTFASPEKAVRALAEALMNNDTSGSLGDATGSCRAPSVMAHGGPPSDDAVALKEVDDTTGTDLRGAAPVTKAPTWTANVGRLPTR